MEKEVGIAEAPKRIEWVDVAKGLGLFLTILGHLLYSGTWSVLNRAIYSFHMPMYFILSGFVASKKCGGGTLKFTLNKAYRLLLPAVIFIILSLPMYFIYFHASAAMRVRMIFFVDGLVAFNDPIWFLIVMFEVAIIAKIFDVKSLSAIEKGVLTLCLFVIGYVVYQFKVPLPFGLDKMFVCFGFYTLGSFLRDLPRNKIASIVTLALSAVLWPLFGIFLNSKVSLYAFALDNYWFFIISSITGSLLWFGLCSLFKRVRLFSFWGQNTIFIVGTQYLWIFFVKKLASTIGISGTIYFDLAAIAISILALFLYIPICVLVNKYLPFIVGRIKKPTKGN